MYALIFIILIPISIISWCIYALIKSRFTLSHIPGWKLRNPIFGTTVDAGLGIPERYRYEYENFGRIYRMYCPLSSLYVVITDPDVAKHILQSNCRNYIRPPLTGMGVFRRLVGENSILLTNGPMHKIQRSLATPAFTPANIRQLTPIMLECGLRLIRRLSGLSGLVDIRQALSRCTLDIIGKAGFGFEFDCCSDTDSSASIGIRMVMDYVSNFRIWSYLPYTDRLPIKRNRDFDRGLEQLHAIVDRMIDQRTMGGECKNLLDMMILGNSEKSIDRSSLRDQLMTFLMAGHETSSLALTYAVYFLCKNIDWQARCRLEVSQMDVRDYSYEKFESLKLVKAVVHETLRLLPPVFALARRAVNADQLGPYAIPAGTDVAVLVTQMHRIPEIWGHDSYRFDPDRFLPDEIPWYAYMPFGEGARKCVGYRFALHEITVILAMLLKNFLFELDPTELDKHLEFIGIVTMMPKRPIRIRLKKID